jgi:uncharacterized protein
MVLLAIVVRRNMARQLGTLGFAAALLAALPSLALAQPAGVDCRSATLPAELEICRLGFLSALDRQMLAAYGELRRRLAPPEQLALDASQQRWQMDRDRCGANIPCLRALYARRMDELYNWH